MVWDFFAWTLSPIVWLMDQLLGLFALATGSVGLSILLLSFAMMLLAHPIRKKARAVEARVTEKSRRVSDDVRALPADLKGEKRFLATEEIYKAHGYHPIQAIAQGASFFVVLPILLSAIVLFNGSLLIQGQSFGFISDLSAPDHLLGPVNLLPLLMTAITIADARLRFAADKAAQYKFYAIALVLLVLVYGMPSALVLYWTGSNLLTYATVARLAQAAQGRAGRMRLPAKRRADRGHIRAIPAAEQTDQLRFPGRAAVARGLPGFSDHARIGGSRSGGFGFLGHLLFSGQITQDQCDPATEQSPKDRAEKAEPLPGASVSSVPLSSAPKSSHFCGNGEKRTFTARYSNDW